MHGRWILAFCALVALFAWIVCAGQDEALSPAPLPAADAPTGIGDVPIPSGPILRGKGTKGSAKAPWLTVSVVEASNGQPLPDAEFLFMLRRADSPDHEVRAFGTTDVDGRHRIGPLVTADIKVQVLSRHHRAPSTWLSPTRSDGGLDLVVRLERGLSITGHIVVPEGVPAERIRLTVRVGNVNHTHLRIDAAGAFGIHSLEEGAAEIVALAAHEDRRYFGRLDTEAGTKDVSVTLGDARRGDLTYTRVRILDPDLDPVAGELSFEQVAADSWGAGGLHHIPGQTALEHEFHPQSALYFYARPSPALTLGETVVGPLGASRTDVVIQLRPGLRIAGHVVDPAGKPVVGVGLTLALVHPSPKTQTAPARPKVLTDANGAFTCEGLGDHEYRMQIDAPTTYVALPPRTIRSGTNDVVIELQRGADVAVTVVDYAGRPVEGAVLQLSPGSAGEVERPRQAPLLEGRTDAKGSCRLEGLDSGVVYTLNVKPPDDRTDVLKHVDSAWKPDDAEIRLKRGYAIAGRLQTVSGKPVSGVWVQCHGIGLPHGGAQVSKTADGGVSWTPRSDRTGVDGTFRITGLEAGRYELRPHGRMKGAVAVEAGAADVVLTSPEALHLKLRFVGWTNEDRGARVLTRGMEHDGVEDGAVLKLGGHRRIESDGRVTYWKMDSTDSLEVWVGGLPGGRYAWKKGVSPTGEEIEIPIQRGGTILGRIAVPEGVELDRCWIQAAGPIVAMDMGGDGLLGQFSFTQDEARGTFEIRGVPPGEWRILIGGGQGETTYEAEVRASAGDDVVVKLTKE